jgi:hypothetical protein
MRSKVDARRRERVELFIQIVRIGLGSPRFLHGRRRGARALAPGRNAGRRRADGLRRLAHRRRGGVKIFVRSKRPARGRHGPGRRRPPVRRPLIKRIKIKTGNARRARNAYRFKLGRTERIVANALSRLDSHTLTLGRRRRGLRGNLPGQLVDRQDRPVASRGAFRQTWSGIESAGIREKLCALSAGAHLPRIEARSGGPLPRLRKGSSCSRGEVRSEWGRAAWGLFPLRCQGCLSSVNPHPPSPAPRNRLGHRGKVK